MEGRGLPVNRRRQRVAIWVSVVGEHTRRWHCQCGVRVNTVTVIVGDWRVVDRWRIDSNGDGSIARKHFAVVGRINKGVRAGEVCCWRVSERTVEIEL